MRLARALGLALGLLVAGPALAQVPPYGTPATVGTSPVQVLGTDTSRRKIIFVNPNATALVAVCPQINRLTSTTLVCAVNGAGSITMLPYDRVVIDAPPQTGVPNLSGPWNAVANAGGSALTIIEIP